MEKKRLTAEEIIDTMLAVSSKSILGGRIRLAMQEFTSQESSAKDERIKELEEALRTDAELFERCWNVMYTEKHLYHPDIFETISKRVEVIEKALIH